jgi:DNA-binding NtrC family response regulator
LKVKEFHGSPTGFDLYLPGPLENRTNPMSSGSASPTNVISVLIADDQPVVREGLAAIFKTQKDIKVVAEATNGEEALELSNQHSPDVLLLDLRMPKKDGLQVITELAARRLSKPRIIVIRRGFTKTKY